VAPWPRTPMAQRWATVVQGVSGVWITMHRRSAHARRMARTVSTEFKRQEDVAMADTSRASAPPAGYRADSAGLDAPAVVWSHGAAWGEVQRDLRKVVAPSAWTKKSRRR
jgi:hypothetical protein